ncbi:uncharacterized protein LOC118188433 [Stegodyphus dumicola]|uniref:uncharacterized protein LOC118188433 n=1 Tax=Stegodyphus dumicola TaxID=202533 RepID=UPI0015B222A9|nr:uncharacterized protein LOC118188433 [Stegodyphus dumicola]
MQLFGVDVGELYPQDTRNLTLLYPNLYLHNRVGRCDMEIMDAKNRKMTRKVEFDTTLIKLGGLIPRLLQNYYNPREMIDCKSTDEDPLNACQPYPCLVRYDGTRNMYNHTTKRCEQIPKCIPETEKDLIDEAYIIETNSCKTLIRSMTEQEFTQFGEGKPSIRVLSRAHGYPLNVRCHNGHRSDTNRWCECKPGWDSAPFDHKNFNPDLQVYHMCTVWTGEMTAEQARNITFRQKHEHGITPILVYSFLFFGGLVSFVIVGIIIFRYLKRRRRPGTSDALDESETVGLQETSPESESELEP